MDIEQIIEIARMYYEQNLSQEDIALKAKISRATVSRALKDARERGFIRTVVISPSEVSQRLQDWLRTCFNLKFVAIAPSRTDTDASIDLVGQVAAAHLEATVTQDCVLGVAGGRTMLSLARQLKPADRPGVLVLPIMGGWIGQTAICASDVAREIAERWNARANVLFAPALVKDEIARQALLREEAITEILRGASNADMAVIGIASVTLEVNAGDYVSGTGRISSRDVAELVKRGVVGETCAQFFDIKGRPVDVWNRTRTIAVPLEDLVKMPNVLAVGAGADKARAFLGACRMGIVKSLIVSEDLASEMQRLDALE